MVAALNNFILMTEVVLASSSDTADIGDYRVIGRLGSGTFGEVRLISDLLHPSDEVYCKMEALCAKHPTDEVLSRTPPLSRCSEESTKPQARRWRSSTSSSRCRRGVTMLHRSGTGRAGSWLPCVL